MQSSSDVDFIIVSINVYAQFSFLWNNILSLIMTSSLYGMLTIILLFN